MQTNTDVATWILFQSEPRPVLKHQDCKGNDTPLTTGLQQQVTENMVASSIFSIQSMNVINTKC